MMMRTLSQAFLAAGLCWGMCSHAATGTAPRPLLPDARPGAYLTRDGQVLPPPPPGLPALSAQPVTAPPLVLPPPAESPKPVPAPATSEAKATAPSPSTSALMAAQSLVPAEPLPGVDNGAEAKRASQQAQTREALQQARAKCQLALASVPVIKASFEGGSYPIRLRVQGGRACVNSLGSSEAWTSLSSLTPTFELQVTVAPNDDEAARTAEVFIGNTKDSVKVLVEQAANTTGFRRLDL